ncbi:Retrovirus-related Pol polyprotein from transposon 17.6, partial [Mucuna pruriens]
MCDVSNSALGAVLDQRARISQSVHVIAYASRTMDPAQSNYMIIEKELLVIVFALDKSRSYLLDSKIVVFSNHVALKFLLKKPDTKSRLIRWLLLLQEFDIEGVENSVADHLSRIGRESEPIPIRDKFPDEQLLHITTPTPWCIPKAKINSVLQLCHTAPGGGHYGSTRTTKKVLDCGLYWPTIFRDAYQFIFTYGKCQKAGMAITRA